MDIIFRTKKLQKQCSIRKEAVREWGERRGWLVMRRLDDIKGMANLSELMKLPNARCHPLILNRKGQFAVDLDHPYRLVFEPANDPLPKMPDGGLDYEKITLIRILEVIDYHD